MEIAATNIDAFRSLSLIFTPSNFDRILRLNDVKKTRASIKKYVTIKEGSTYGQILESLYTQLQEKYCSEYIYKNTLLNQYFLEKYSLNTTTVLNEFKINSSIADFVLLNGTARIYEIKTELDNLGKLDKQIEDYVRFANEVYVVTTSKYIPRLLKDYSNSSIGLIEFTSDNRFKQHKAALSNEKSFDHLTIFKTLRKGEYLSIIENYFGFIPDVPNTRIYNACLDLCKEIDVREFQKIVFNTLKKRKISSPDFFKSSATPYELKQICYSLNLSIFEYQILYDFLNKSF